MITTMITFTTVLIGSGIGMAFTMVDTAHQINPAMTK